MISDNFINEMGGPYSNHFVVGINFGDEGKGHITNTLCKRFSQFQKVVNSRYNGGPQAGHTVYNNGKRFVFSSLPSGMKYVDTVHYHPNKYHVFNPVDWLIEYETYQKISEPRETPTNFSMPSSITPITFYDVNANRIDQMNLEHGSCGMGIGKTIYRSTNSFPFNNYIENFNYTSRQVEDHIRTYLKNVKEEYYPSMTDYSSLGGLSENAWIEFYIYCYLKMRDIIKSVNNGRYGFFSNDKIHIFEGAQGIGLDRNLDQYFPHVTPSYTGSKEMIDFLNEYYHRNYNNIGVTYVSRIYMTRHGNSAHFRDTPSVNEYFDIVDKTNIPNQYQGSMKFDYFDLKKIIQHIIYDRPSQMIKYNFALTCVDQIKDRSLMKWKDARGILKIAHFDDFIHQLKFELKKLNFKYLLISSGVEPEDVVDYKL